MKYQTLRSLTFLSAMAITINVSAMKQEAQPPQKLLPPELIDMIAQNLIDESDFDATEDKIHGLLVAQNLDVISFYTKIATNMDTVNLTCLISSAIRNQRNEAIPLIKIFCNRLLPYTHQLLCTAAARGNAESVQAIITTFTTPQRSYITRGTLRTAIKIAINNQRLAVAEYLIKTSPIPSDSLCAAVDAAVQKKFYNCIMPLCNDCLSLVPDDEVVGIFCSVIASGDKKTLPDFIEEFENRITAQAWRHGFIYAAQCGNAAIVSYMIPSIQSSVIHQAIARTQSFQIRILLQQELIRRCPQQYPPAYSPIFYYY